MDVSRLRATAYALFGRDTWLERLTAAWNDQQIRIVSIVAMAGTGKTALASNWVHNLGKDATWGGAESVFAWSFFSQGASVNRQVSSDLFAAEAIRFFGIQDPGPVSPWEKGRLLAETIRQKRILLVLDGLEPLQEPPGFGDRAGLLHDQTVFALLRELSTANTGLCIVTTRLPLADLLNVPPDNHYEINLEQLDDVAGAKLLRHLLVPSDAPKKQIELVRITPEKELRQASSEFGGHALALRLLANYLASPPYDGDIRRRTEIGPLLEEEEDGAQARRVIRKYEEWFEGTPELDILQLVGLFDRPAESDAIVKLRKPPPIRYLTDQFPYPDNAKWNRGLRLLRRLGLITTERSEPLDCHPLLREYFGTRLRTASPEAWVAAHSRLYEYFRAPSRETLPDSLAEMEPLFRAVAHGCQAGREREVFEEVYLARIRQGDRAYSVKVLGAFGSDLAALSWFFKNLWYEPVGSLDDGAQISVLNFAGFRLFGLGRIREALEPTQRSFELIQNVVAQDNGSGTASLLAEMFLALGRIYRAIEFGQKSVTLADSTGDTLVRLTARTTYGAALTQLGDVEQAKTNFSESVELSRRLTVGYLYSVQGYFYCDFLLSQLDFESASAVAAKIVAQGQQMKIPLDAALGRLVLAKCALARKKSLDGDPVDSVRRLFDQAVDELRSSGRVDYLPLGLLARAAMLRDMGKLAEASRVVAEAQEIATRCEMKINLVDSHLEAARLALAEGKKDLGRDHLATARQMIEEIGYGRRNVELFQLEEELNEH